MAGRLEGTVTVITGGASGIGRACAQRFAEEGAKVVVADLDEARGAETVALVKALGQSATFVRTDTSVEADCEALADAAIKAFGQIGSLVAAAGISHARYVSGSGTHEAQRDHARPSVLTKPTEYWEKVLAVNLTGVMMTGNCTADDRGRAPGFDRQHRFWSGADPAGGVG